MKSYLILKNTSLFLILLLTIAVGQAAELLPLKHSLRIVNPEQKAPPLILKNLKQQDVDINDFKGKVVVINFWATWCPPCRQEMQFLEKMHQTIGHRNVVVLAINVGESVTTASDFINQLNPKPGFDVLFDIDSNVSKQWQVAGLPMTYVIDTKGNIAYQAMGAREFSHPDILRKTLSLFKTNK